MAVCYSLLDESIKKVNNYEAVNIGIKSMFDFASINLSNTENFDFISGLPFKENGSVWTCSEFKKTALVGCVIYQSFRCYF